MEAQRRAKKPRYSEKKHVHSSANSSNMFYAFFQNAIGSTVVLTMKNGIRISGKLVVLDPNLNVYLEGANPVKREKNHSFLDQMKSLIFVRGSSVEHIQFEPNCVNYSAMNKWCRER